MTTKRCPDCGEELSEEGYCASCRAKSWILGQKKAKKDYKPEAFSKYWSEKNEREQEEREETKGNE